MGRMVIVAYRPREGRRSQLVELVRGHVPALRALGLATERPSVSMTAANGTIVEVFEWVSASAVERAHTHETIKTMWGKFAEVCEYEMLSNLPECQHPFSEFEPLD